MYYLQTRYYDPAICRFINADDVEYLGANGDLAGYNLYAYCSNNPVMYCDPTGHFPWLILAAAVLLFTPVGGILTQAVVSTVSYVAASGWALGDLIFNEGNGAWTDMCDINWNPFNTDANKAADSEYLSFYRGVPILQGDRKRGLMSLGLIFFDRDHDAEVLKHERGHNTQLMSMGVGNYLIQIGIPSVWKNGDETFWELSASMLGGSTLADGYSKEQKRQANNYYHRARIPIVNIYNIFQYIFY